MNYLLITLSVLILGALGVPVIFRYYKRLRRRNKKIVNRSSNEGYERTEPYFQTQIAEEAAEFAPPIVDETVTEATPEPKRWIFKKKLKKPTKEGILNLFKKTDANVSVKLPEEVNFSFKKKLRSESPSSELIIPIYVVTRSEYGFAGKDIITVLEDLGLRYGEKKIFHHYGVGEIRIKKPVFSVANMMEPGAFDLQQIEDFATPGLVLFMRLPGPFGGRVAFELMLNTAQKLAESLEGSLTDERHISLTSQTIHLLRERIANFEQREVRLSMIKRFS